jgi:radical SAM protein with 4Fe4S-binding SPASM domain
MLYYKVNIEISNVCNLQCSFCPEVIRPKKLIDLDLFRRIIEQVSPLTEQVCFHLMGDPLMHSKLEDLVEICEEYGTKIFFVTNGVLLREKHMEILLRPVFRQVNFSLHSFHDNFPEKDPTDYLDRIFDYSERALVERPDLYINYRLWNLQDVRGMGTKNLDILERVQARFSTKVHTESLDVRHRKSRHLRGRLYLHFDTEFTWPSLDLPVLGELGRCHGLSTHFGILVDGTVVPCCLDKEGVIELGNIKDRELSEILESPRATEILNGFRKGKLVEALCQKCQYIERFKSPRQSK